MINSRLSMRSNRPPCPMIDDPESLILAARFNLESLKSPSKPARESITPINNAPIWEMANIPGIKNAQSVAVTTIPPKTPSSVLWGLNLGAMYVFPNTDPATY